MSIEIVHEYDDAGNDVGWYTESVPETYVKEEPDCYDCNDAGCPACNPSEAELRKLERTSRLATDTSFVTEPPF